MKRYFKVGIGTIIPIALVAQVILWLVSFVQNNVLAYFGPEIALWQMAAIIAGLLMSIVLLGVIFTHINFVKRWKKRIESSVIEKIPGIKTVYSFGRELVDTFITDIKEDGDFTVIEVDLGGFKALGVLTDPKNSLGFIISAPSPLTGIVMKLPNYKILDMTFADAVKINTSLGRLNGSKWTLKE